MKLVLDHAMLAAARLRLPQQRARLSGGRRHRFFAIDVLAGGDRLFENRGALLRGRRIEEDRVSGIGERGVEIGGPSRERAHARACGKAIAIAAAESRARSKALIYARAPTRLECGERCMRQKPTPHAA